MNREPSHAIDDALVPFSEMLAAIIPDNNLAIAEESGLVLESLQIEFPIELDVIRRDKGGIAIGTSPPLYYIETGFSPVMHQVKITLRLDVKLVNDGEQ